jgi:C4-dicarboxylate-specific signal transduction histidine kinase
MFGLDPDREHHFHDILRCIHPDDRERVGRFVDDPQQVAARVSIEYRVVGSEGQIRWLASHGSSREGHEGREADARLSSTLMGATIDISERKRAEDEAALQRFELEHLSRVAGLSELSGALAHELNQPLAIIMSNAEAAQRLLQHPVPDLPEIRAILDDIVAADDRAGEVIKRLRGLLKRAAPDRRPMSLDEVVRSVLRFMQVDLVRRGVTVELALDDLPHKVFADRVPIEQVLINLISNACDAMAANAPGDRVLRITSNALDGMAQVRIVDVGSGLPKQPDRVFDPFYTTKPEGLGLGLPISRSIIRAHGGRLWAAANADRGAVFQVCLPLEPEVA